MPSMVGAPVRPWTGETVLSSQRKRAALEKGLAEAYRLSRKTYFWYHSIEPKIRAKYPDCHNREAEDPDGIRWRLTRARRIGRRCKRHINFLETQLEFFREFLNSDKPNPGYNNTQRLLNETIADLKEAVKLLTELQEYL